MPFSLNDRVVFDLDDTLFPERAFVRSGFDAVGNWVLGRTGKDGFAAQCRAMFEAGRRGDIFDRALMATGLPADLAPQLVAVYRDHQPRISLYPDARLWLEARGGPFALITDGPERTQRNKIAALGLSRWFDLMIPTGQWVGNYAKPHPRAFELVQEHAHGRPCIYVADNATKDFVTPNRMGWRTVQSGARTAYMMARRPPAPMRHKR